MLQSFSILIKRPNIGKSRKQNACPEIKRSVILSVYSTILKSYCALVQIKW